MKNRILALSFVVFAITGCGKWEHVQFVENDITIDGKAQTVILTATKEISPVYAHGYYPLVYVKTGNEEVIEGRTFRVMEIGWAKVMMPYDDNRTLYVQFAENDTSVTMKTITDTRYRDSLRLGRCLDIRCIDAETCVHAVVAHIRQLPLSNEQ